MTGPMDQFARSRARDGWAATRSRMEAGTRKHTPRGSRFARHWALFETALRGFGVALRGTGLWRRGVKNALDVGLEEMEIAFPDLPPAFDGYRVLHLADLHLDAHGALPRRVAGLVERAPADLCVLTGDYRYRVNGPITGAVAGLARVVRKLSVKDGIYAVLGNHDSVAFVPALEFLGVRVLVNQTATLSRGGQSLHVTGIDDVHYFYTDSAAEALRQAPDGFRLALVHSPELVEQAAQAGVSLYLTGHTHGGQVCLPGGVPLITHSIGRRVHTAGLWRHGPMVGYTSCGVGVSGLPVRFNTRGEVTLITLRRAPGD